MNDFQTMKIHQRKRTTFNKPNSSDQPTKPNNFQSTTIYRPTNQRKRTTFKPQQSTDHPTTTNKLQSTTIYRPMKENKLINNRHSNQSRSNQSINSQKSNSKFFETFRNITLKFEKVKAAMSAYGPQKYAQFPLGRNTVSMFVILR